MNWYLAVLKNYAGFSGRARRTEYWMFVLFNILIAIAVIFIGELLHKAPAVLGLYMLGTFIPGLAVTVRRLHDTGKSGWFIFIVLIPFGNLWLLSVLVTESAKGTNEYGTDPKSQNAEDFSSALDATI